MGHYANELKETGNEFKFSTIAASIIPYVWLKDGIGTMQFVISYDKDNIAALKEKIENGSEYEKEIATDILTLLSGNTEKELILQIELDASAGKLLIDKE